MKLNKNLKSNRPILLAHLCLAIIFSLLLLASCSDPPPADDPGGDEFLPYVNVYIPECDLIVTVEYDSERGQLIELENTIKSEMGNYSYPIPESAFLGLYDMA
ncbi:MAG: hypothetical protein IJV68_06765, partial [Clostridia bacterium]|nr:hypothetical protein [Clostridia bacterium]